MNITIRRTRVVCCTALFFCISLLFATLCLLHKEASREEAAENLIKIQGMKQLWESLEYNFTEPDQESDQPQLNGLWMIQARQQQLYLLREMHTLKHSCTELPPEIELFLKQHPRPTENTFREFNEYHIEQALNALSRMHH